jgi:hypothetical protein
LEKVGASPIVGSRLRSYDENQWNETAQKDVRQPGFTPIEPYPENFRRYPEMNKKLVFAVVLALVFTLAFGTIALAQEETPPATTDTPAAEPFYMEVAHRIQGNQIGLTRETPVALSIYRNGVPVSFARMNYMDRIGVNLFEGDFEFEFMDLETGEVLLRCGAFSFGETSQVRVQVHEKGAGRIPACYIKEFE